MKGLIDFLSNLIPITGNDIVDTIIFFVIAFIAFAIAWWITGLVAEDVDYNSSAMSGIHWLVRVAVWMGLVLFAIGIVHLVKWFLSFEWWVYLIIGISLFLIIGSIIFLKIFTKKRKQITE